MNNACGTSSGLCQVMRIDSRRWISLIIRCSLDLMLQPEQILTLAVAAYSLS